MWRSLKWILPCESQSEMTTRCNILAIDFWERQNKRGGYATSAWRGMARRSRWLSRWNTGNLRWWSYSAWYCFWLIFLINRARIYLHIKNECRHIPYTILKESGRECACGNDEDFTVLAVGVVDAVEWACVLCGCHIQNDWVRRAAICIKFYVKLKHSSAEMTQKAGTMNH